MQGLAQPSSTVTSVSQGLKRKGGGIERLEAVMLWLFSVKWECCAPFPSLRETLCDVSNS